ncbi:MAG: prefoldin subunit beta [Thermoprotei archaeon]|nr:MAG: prefoldin subunit beta [Thermoprotei archaeon]
MSTTIDLRNLPPHLQAEIGRLQQLQEQLQMLIMRRQQWENELREIESAISELEKISENTPVYKIAGPILVASTRDKALQDLKERREIVELHIKTLSRQESLLRKQIEELSKKVSEELSRLRQQAQQTAG